MFQLFQAVKRHSAAVLQQRDHRGRGLVVFFGADAFRFGRGEHFAAQIAAQTIQLIHGGCQRRLSHDAHQRLWVLSAGRLCLSRSPGMDRRRASWDAEPQLVRAGVGCERRCARDPWSEVAFSAGVRFRRLQHRAGLLRAAWFRQHSRQRVQRLFELFAFRFAQRRVRCRDR